MLSNRWVQGVDVGSLTEIFEIGNYKACVPGSETLSINNLLQPARLDHGCVNVLGHDTSDKEYKLYPNKQKNRFFERCPSFF
jgi:hypothetical protein